MSSSLLIDIALKEVGYTEGANNANKYSAALHRPAESWCADFVVWCFQQSNNQGKILNSASVSAICDWARKNTLVVDPKTVQAGDIVTFDWTGKRQSPVHIGIVRAPFDSKKILVPTIEGNTSANNTGSQSNGDCVALKERGLAYIYLAFRPKY